MNKHVINFMLLFASILFIACGKSDSPTPMPEGGKFQISVPTSIEAGVGDVISFNFYGENTPKENDIIRFKNTKNESNLPITRINSNSLSFKLGEELQDGHYRIYLDRNENGDKQTYFIGNTKFTFIERIIVPKKEGKNIYGIVLCDGEGVPGVVISDGVEVTKTNEEGIYYLESDKKYGYVWMSVPSGYEASSIGLLPEFWQQLGSEDKTLTERFDFNLQKVNNDNFTLFVLGDMHLANRNSDIAQFKEFATDFNATISNTPGPKYGLTLGDMTWDLYWYDNSFSFSQYLNLINKELKEDIQIYHTMGNHDNDYKRIGDFNKEIPYRDQLTPTYYSYNIGKWHFIVLDDIDFNDIGAGKELRALYKKNITADQMAWLKKDLETISKDTPIILSSHAPLHMPGLLTEWKSNLTGANAAGEANTQDLLSILKPYTTHYFTGHTHKTFNIDELDSNNFFEHNAGSICGSWWWSGSLTPGINIGQDGSTGGYTIVKINGKDISWKYKSTGYPENHQFHSYDMNEAKKTITLESGGNKSGFRTFVSNINNYNTNDVLINIWNYDPKWKVEVTENGKALTVKKTKAYDPLHIMAMTAKRFQKSDRPNFQTEKWPHFFLVTANSDNSTLEIKVTDRFGNVYKENMKRPKACTTNNYLTK